MGRPLAVALALALVSVSRTSVAQTPQFSDAERARLESGEILVKRVEPKGGAGVAAKAVALVRSHPDRVWPIVNDCTNFKEFMPRTTKSEERADGKHCLVEVTMPFPFSNLWSETKVRQEVLDNGGRRRAWSLVDGTYEHLTGSWTVLPWGGKRKRDAAPLHDRRKPRRVRARHDPSKRPGRHAPRHLHRRPRARRRPVAEGMR